MTELTERVREQLGALIGAATPAQFQTLGRSLTELRLRHNDVLLQEGCESDAVFLVTDGSLTATLSGNGETIALGQIAAGEWIGEVSMLHPGPATATVVAESDCSLLRLGADGFKTLAQEDAVLANALLRSLCGTLIARLRTTDNLVFADEFAERDRDTRAERTKTWLIHAYRQLLDIGERAK